MFRRAIYPASFDPVTNGHIDVAMRASRLFDELVVAAYDSPSKNLLFSTTERLEMLQECFKDMPNIRVSSYKGLTVHYAEQIGAIALVRGLRTVSDFEYELQLTHNYRHLAPAVEICCLMTDQRYSYLSSTMIKEIARLGGDISKMVPSHVEAKVMAAYGIEKKEIGNFNLNS